MNEESQILKQACSEVEEAVRSSFLLALEGWQEHQKAQEIAAWQVAWAKWTATVEAAAATIPQGIDNSRSASECQAAKKSG